MGLGNKVPSRLPFRVTIRVPIRVMLYGFRVTKLHGTRIIPLGSKCPNSMFSRSINHSEYAFWDLKPY